MWPDENRVIFRKEAVCETIMLTIGFIKEARSMAGSNRYLILVKSDFSDVLPLSPFVSFASIVRCQFLLSYSWVGIGCWPINNLSNE